MKRGSINFLIVKQNRRNVYVSFEDTDKLNILVSEELKNNLFNIIKVPRTNLILNLGNIKFIDSTGFGVLNFIARVSRTFGSYFTLSNVSDELLELINVYRKFNILEISNIEKNNIKQLTVA